MTIASTATAPAAVTTGRGNADSTNLPTLAQELSSTVMWAALILFVFFGVFGSWLVLAPLSSAAIATGVVSPDSSRKAVQHLEGGIIKDIHVKDGDYVNTGATLLTLDDTQSRAQFQANRAQLIRLRAIKARIQALQINAPEVAFDAETRETAATDTELALFLKAQTELFTTRRDAALGRKTVFERQIEQLREQTVGVDAELKGNLTQL
jgi:epimerase transport system membrane fusion protein